MRLTMMVLYSFAQCYASLIAPLGNIYLSFQWYRSQIQKAAGRGEQPCLHVW